MTEAELGRLLEVARRRPLLNALTVRRGRRKGERDANVRAEVRMASRDDGAVDDIVAELLGLDVDVIVVASGAALHAAQRATARVPIVAMGVAIDDGRWNANVTGVAVVREAVNEGCLHLLTALVPRLSRVGLLLPDAADGAAHGVRDTMATSTVALGATLVVVDAPDDAALDAAFASAAGLGIGGMIVPIHERFVPLRARIADAAMTGRVPAVSALPGFATAGGLAEYAPDPLARYREAARYVDRILRGASPAALPPTTERIEICVNLRSAKALELSVPSEVLRLATRVIE
jgi:putative ABC transport system substrate-binding protein